MRRFLLLLTLLAAAFPAAAQAPLASPAPAAVITDPPPDPAHPTRNVQVLVPSGGLGMNGLFLLASGPGAHPTVLLLHGLPGNERNLDLAQTIRRAGWNVLTFTYRGAWGSPGDFSIVHAMEDGEAAMAFLRDPRTATQFGVDPTRLVIVGHSLGGFVGAAHARRDPALAGLVVLDGWNVGADGAAWSAADQAGRKAFEATTSEDFGNALHGATGASLAAELGAHGRDWNLIGWAPQLTRLPLLAVGAERGDAAVMRALAAATGAAGGRADLVVMPTDHPFSDHRIALGTVVVNWLERLAKP